MRAVVTRLCLLVAAATSATGLAAQDPVPAHEEARHHLVLDDARFRILDVQIPPGDTTDFHLHDVPIAYVAVSPAAVGTQRLDGAWRTTARSAASEAGIGRVTWNESYPESPVVHRVANADDHLFRLIAVVNRGAGDSASDPSDLGAAGPAAASSRWYRSVALEIHGGTSFKWAPHPRPVVAVLVSDGQVALGPGGVAAEGIGAFLVLEPGETYTLRAADGDLVSLALVEVR